MSLLLAFFLIIISSLFISKCADLIVEAVIRLSRMFRVSEFAIGFLVLGIATSTPEIFVGVNSILDGKTEISLGNLLGASIVLLTLVIGLNAVINKEVRFSESFHKGDIYLISLIILAQSLFIFDGKLSRLDGLAMLILYFIFIIVINKRQPFIEHLRDTLFANHHHIAKILFRLFIGATGIFITAKVIVETVKYIAIELNLPLVLLGLLVVSIGTNLPEITILIRSINKHHNQIGIGDFLGSAVANTPILGLIAVVSPITIDNPIKVYFGVGILAASLIMFNVFFSTGRKISRREGIILLALYSFFLFSEILIR